MGRYEPRPKGAANSIRKTKVHNDIPAASTSGGTLARLYEAVGAPMPVMGRAKPAEPHVIAIRFPGRLRCVDEICCRSPCW